MKLYIDLCVFNRPFDYQGQERIALESSAFIYLLEKLGRFEHTLVISSLWSMKTVRIHLNKKGFVWLPILRWLKNLSVLITW